MQEKHTPSERDQAPATQRPPSPFDSPIRFVGRSATGLTIYLLLITGYILVLRLLSKPLLNLYNSRMALYTIVALILIVAQGIILEYVTATLAEHLGVVTHEE